MDSTPSSAHSAEKSQSRNADSAILDGLRKTSDWNHNEDWGFPLQESNPELLGNTSMIPPDSVYNVKKLSL
jgi:hypothetical protein